MINKIKALNVIINQLRYILTQRQKHLLVLVIILTLINALLQTLGVSIIVPFVSAMTDLENFMNNDIVSAICSGWNITDIKALFIGLCIIVIFLYLFKNAFSIFQVWVSTRYANKVYRELSTSLFEGYLKRNYDFFLGYGTAEAIRDIYQDASGVFNVLDAMINLLTEFLTIVFILVYITLMDWQMALCILVMSGICLLVINTFFRRKMKENGEKIRIYHADVQGSLMQAIEGIKEVQVMHKQEYFIEKYNKCLVRLQKPAVVQAVGLAAPTYVVEGLFVSGIMAFISFKVITDPNYTDSLPVMASFMMGAIRMLPSLGRISARVNSITFNIAPLQSVYTNMKRFENEIGADWKKETLKQSYTGEVEKIEPARFENELRISDIWYRYAEAKSDTLRGLRMEIKKGESVGIIGSSGAGKSTLADVILGLHVPQKGEVLLDNVDISQISRSYGKIIGFIPQSVYLVDGDIRDNVAFGVDREDVDDDKVWECLEKSQLADFIMNKEEGLDTVIGERGVKLSGGQRQRIAVARALYRNPQILVMDEATSALDNETERAMMEAIERLYGTITMIIIAHRLTTVQKCDNIYEIVDGKAVKKSKEELFGGIMFEHKDK